MRSPSPLFAFADRVVDEQAALDPCAATARGIPGHDHLLTDWSPDGHAARANHTRRARATLDTLPVTDEHDRLARDFIAERFDTSLLAFDTGEWMRALRAIAAPASALRGTFDLMSRDGSTAWENIAHRLEAVPAALEGLRATYQQGRTDGRMAARRQALAAADQAATWSANRWFDTLADEAAGAESLHPALVGKVREGAADANRAFAAFADYLRSTYAPAAPEADGCGPERYRVGVRQMLGADFDPAEMYEWAWADFHALRAEIAATCEEILPGAGFAEVIDLLEHPQLSKGDQILAIPTLVRRLPKPMRKIIGDLSDTERVLIGLDLRSADASG